MDIVDVGKKLNVRYVLEGSIRKSGKRIRVTAQLIDATTGGHIWADRYDRDVEEYICRARRSRTRHYCDIDRSSRAGWSRGCKKEATVESEGV